MSWDAHCFEDAVAHTDVDEDPCEDFCAESFVDLLVFLCSGDFFGDELVEGGHVFGDGVVDELVVDFGDGLEHNAVADGGIAGDHGVFTEESCEADGGVFGLAEVCFPLFDGLFSGALDEGDEEVAL